MEQSQGTIGNPIKCKAAVAFKPKEPLQVVEVEVAPPKAGEVRVKIIANALCQADINTLEGNDPEGLFPTILGHEATGIVESVGEGVTSVAVGDMVIPCNTPQCKELNCIYCQSTKSNLCPKIRGTQGKGQMIDGTSRFTYNGQIIHHFMGCSTFSEYTVIAEISAAKINPAADLNKLCVLGCGVATGWGAAFNNPVIEPGTSVAVWGLGTVGLAVIQAAKAQGATRIYGFDVNPPKFEFAKKLGACDCYNPKDGKTREWLLEKEPWGINYTYACTGNVSAMREALELAHRGYGESCVIGVAAAGKEIATRPFQLVTGRQWKGIAFGGWKSRDDVPKLVNKALLGELNIDHYITHYIEGLDKVNDSIEALRSGKCLRAVVKINPIPQGKKNIEVKVDDKTMLYGGALKTVSFWSEACQCRMKFKIFLPSDEVKCQRREPFPVLYFLGGLTSDTTNVPVKSGFGPYAAKHRLAIVFPDTSPRDVDIPGVKDDWEIGDSAGFYVNATNPKWSQHFNMQTYLTKEIPDIINAYFHVDPVRVGITGFSMGGFGALLSHLKNPGYFKSVSAFAPINNIQSHWGKKMVDNYFNSVQEGAEWDPSTLVKSYQGPKLPILIDIGTSDEHWEKIMPRIFVDACHESNYPVVYNERHHYSHSFYFVTTFLESHFEFHSRELHAGRVEI